MTTLSRTAMGGRDMRYSIYDIRAAARDAVWRDRLSAIEAGHLRPAGRRWFRGGAPIDPLAEALEAAWDAAWDAWGAAVG